ncbi:FHA domain-containing protein [Chloroflexia bacterium SDU3-3]|nr:FHA domain-containing protein [Chloroflexia bacterium SDU3-3]
MLPQIFLAQPPATAQARRTLRAHALELAAQLVRVAEGPCYAILNIEPAESEPIDMLLLRPRSALVALVRQAEGPLRVQGGHPWLAQARQARADALAMLGGLAPALGTAVAAVVAAPRIPEGSSIALDVEDHRQRVKLLGFDELAALASMLQAGAQLDEAAMRGAAQALDAQLWHNGERLLFEIGLAPYVLRRGDGATLPLLEGASVVGRRKQAIQHEYRLTIEGDDAVSADHAIIVCAPSGRLLLRDTSTNGTYIRAPGGSEQRIHHAEQAIAPDTIIRLGETELALVRA